MTRDCIPHGGIVVILQRRVIVIESGYSKIFYFYREGSYKLNIFNFFYGRRITDDGHLDKVEIRVIESRNDQ